MFTLKIKPDSGEPFEVVTTSRDIVRWEMGGNRQDPRSISRLSDNLRMSDITDLAWFAASRRGLTDLDIRQWRESVDIDFDRVSGDDEDGSGEEGPTPPGR